MKQEIAEEIVFSTEGFYLHEGIENMLAKKLNCVSFIDVIRACQTEIGSVSQQIWTCKKCPNNCAIIYCTDEQKRLLYMQNLAGIQMDKSSVQLMVNDGFVTFDVAHSLSRINNTAQLN